MDRMLASMEQLQRQNAQLQQQLAAVLEENARLRQRLADFPTSGTHAPHSPLPSGGPFMNPPMPAPAAALDAAPRMTGSFDSMPVVALGGDPRHGL